MFNEAVQHYILKGRKVVLAKSLIEWSKWFENSKERIIKQEYIENYFVSTVFLGLDHSFSMGKNHKPVLFETMIFNDKNKRKDKFGLHDYQERCSTYEEAEIMHKKAVDLVKYKLSKGGLLWKFFTQIQGFLLNRGQKTPKRLQ